MRIRARWEARTGDRYETHYASRRGFLMACSRSRDTFIDMVDVSDGTIVKGTMGLTLYRMKGKK